MKNLLLIAPPAGGKGTISERLVDDYGYEHVSTGDLLRALDKSTSFGQEIAEKLASGVLIDDETVMRLLEEKIASLDGKPFILDGCPRNISQAKRIDEMFKEMNLSLDIVIELDVPYDVVLKRAVGRVSCPKCKSIYNTYFKKPLIDGVCDKCGEELTHRSDDNEETFKVRYDAYMSETTPLIDYYQEQGKCFTVGGDDIYELVVELIK